MIKTRFDNTEFWETKSETHKICDMETAHIINLIRLFKRKPSMILRILLESIDDAQFSFSKNNAVNATKEVTSMTEEELIGVAMNSDLVRSLKEELEERGVNTENVLQLRDREE